MNVRLSLLLLQYIGELDLKKRPVKRAYPYSGAWSSVKVGIGVGSLDKEAEDWLWLSLIPRSQYIPMSPPHHFSATNTVYRRDDTL